MSKKELYSAPETEVLELAFEQTIMYVSGDGEIPDMDVIPGGDL